MKRERRVLVGILCGTAASGLVQVHAAAPLSIGWFGAAVVAQSPAVESAAAVPIEPTGTEGPVADAGGPYRWTVGQPVRFDGTASTSSAERALMFSWDFGDGTSGEGAVVGHTYAAAGVFTARLTVTDAHGATATTTTPVTIEAVAPTSKVIWTSVVNAVANGNQIRKTGEVPAPDAGAISRQPLLGHDGYIEFRAKETDTDRVCGLGGEDTGTGPEDVEFGIRLRADGSALIQESGVARGAPARYATGDRLRVWVESGIVRYVHQGRVLGSTAFLARTGIVAPPPPEPDLGWQIVATGDFDGDQDTDIAWRNQAEGGNRVWLMDGTTLVQTVDLPAETDTAWTIVAAADFDGDGGPDLLWSRSTGDVRAWLLDGTTVMGAAVLESEPDLDWKPGGAGDLDGDGDADIVWRHRLLGDNRVWRMNGTTREETVELDAERDLDWELVGVARFGLDAHPDLLWSHSKSREGRVWFMEGLQRQASATIGADAGDLRADWRIAGAGDFNADGQGDVLRRDQGEGGLEVWLLDGHPPLGLRTDTSLWTPEATIVEAVMSGVANDPPVADAGGAYRWTAGETIQFDGTRSTDEDGEIVRYSWSFGDGDEAEGPSPTHAYAAAGQYTVTLTVTDDDGVSTTASTDATLSTFPVQPAVWSNPRGPLGVSGNHLTRVGTASGWNAGAGTHQELAGGNGFVEFTAVETTTERAAGFGQDDLRPTLDDIEFGMRLTSSGDVQAIEAGWPVGEPAPYRTGDRLRVFVDAGLVRYVKSGRVLAVSNRHPVFPLRLDTSLFSPGATIAAAMVGGDQIHFRNAPPTVQLQGIGCHVPCHAVFIANATDPDGDPLTYEWGGCVASGASGPSAICPLPTVGVVTATVRVIDPYGGTSATVSAQAAGTNAPPVVAIGGELACHPPCVANLSAAASDPDGDPLALTWGGCANGQTGVTAACTFPAIPSVPAPVERVVAEMKITTFDVLRIHEAACTGPAAVDTPSCRAAASRFCIGSGYTGGFGPIEYNPTNAWLICVRSPSGALTLTNFAELAAQHPGCTGPEAAMSGACGAASHRYCRTKGHGSGFGPVEYTAQVAYPFCARRDAVRVMQVPFAELQQHHAPCSADTATTACRVAANRYCWAFGYAGGFGPVEYTNETAEVACLPALVTTGSADVSVTADDGRGGVATDAETIALRNARPGVTVAVEPLTCHVPCTATFTARAGDGDGDALSFEWTGCAAGQTGATATCALPTAGTYPVQVTVRDPLGASASASGHAVGTNQPPTVSVSSHRSCHPACTARFTAAASDPDGDALELRWGGCAAGQVGNEALCAFPALPDEPPAVPTPGAVMVTTTFAVLNSHFPECAGPVAAPSVVCQAASHRFCVASGYAGGLGPVEYDTVNAQVLCLGRDMAAVNVTSFTTLATHDAGCYSATVAATNACATAVHRYCAAQGYGSGVGPLEFQGNTAHALCAEAGIARRVDTTFDVLRTHFPTCEAGITAQSSCRVAVARFCRSRGQGGGFGPVESSGAAASVTCMPATTMRVAAPVSVVADDQRGGQATASTSVQVANAVPGQLVVTANPTSCTVPCTIGFTATALDPDGEPLVLAWGGCAVGRVGPQATCDAITPGLVQATVQAVDGRGGIVSGQAQAQAQPADPQQNLPPVARAGGPYRGVATQPVTLDGRASRDPEGRPLTYAWAFGDGTTGTGATPVHTYVTPAGYTVTLTVTDDRGDSASSTATVTVAPLDDPDGDGLPTSVENTLGSNPFDPDTNDDGIPDGAARDLGLSLTDGDMDDDTLANAVEIAAGTDPFRADTDGDGAPDGADAFPLDPTRQNPQPTPGDHTPPTIQLTRPETATPNP